MDERVYHQMSDQPLHSTELLLKSVTGQTLEVLGSGEVTFSISPDHSLTHRFQVVRNLQPYEAILGLNFLSEPRFNIHHDLSNFLLHVSGNQVRLYDAQHHQPCSVIVPIRATGRHQYLRPHTVTFIKAHIIPEALQTSDIAIEDYMEFHSHPREEDEPRPINCIFDRQQLENGEIYIGIANHSSKGRHFSNDEPLGFLTTANAQPFLEVIATIEQEQKGASPDQSQDAPSHGPTPENVPSSHPGASSRTPSRRNGRTPDDIRPNPGKDPPVSMDSSSKEERDKFLQAFQYGDLSTEQMKEVQEMLLEFRDCFAMDEDQLGLCTRITHDIKTLTEDPVVSQPYRVPKALEPEVKRIIQTMMDKKLIRKSFSEYSSPVVLVEKPDKSLRFCVNYQKLNAVSKKRTFPLPNPDELLAKIGENQPKWFSSSDLAAAFYQVPVKEEDRHKTAFILPWGKFEWNVMSMGMSESPYTFARLGMEIFEDILSEEGLILFIDDLGMYSPTFEHHLGTWRKVLLRLRENNLKLKPSKTHLFSTNGLKFLGRHIGPKGVAPNPVKLRAISDYPTPKSVKDVRSFVALCSYFRKHVPHFASISAPLNALTRKGVHFKWSEECEAAFVKLKDALVNSDVLAYPQFSNDCPFIVATDASDHGIGGWISQEDDDGNRRPIAFYSRTFSNAESNYSTIEKEALAIVSSIQAFYYYLHGRSFILESDHAPLKYVLSHAQKGRVQNTRLERWKLALQGVNMTIRYVPGPKNVVADSLSRGALQMDWKELQKEASMDDPDIGIGIAALFSATSKQEHREEASSASTSSAGTATTPAKQTVTPEGTATTLVTQTGIIQPPGDTTPPRPSGSATTLPEPEESASDLRQHQRSDPLWSPLIEVLEGKKVKGNKKIWNDLPSYHLDHGGVLIYQPDETSPPRTVVPSVMVPQLIAESHSHPMAGHYHARAVLDRLKRQFYWPSMSTDVRKYCDSCVKCHSTKTNRRDRPAKLGTTPPSYGPWETVHTDLVGPLPETPEGYRWILLVVCAFTKFVELIPLQDTTAETVGRALVDTFYRYGIPFNLVSDNGPQYRAKLLAEINKVLDVRHIFISAYHSQANSNVERMCGVVKTMIATALERTQRDWHVFLGASQYAVNSTFQSSNKWSPAFLMFGRHLRLPIEQALGEEPPSSYVELEDLVTQLKERQFDAITQVISHQTTSRAYQREKYNERAKDRSFEVGDLVYLFRPIVQPGNASKLTKKWEPGYVVVGRHSNGLTYDVRKPGSRKPPEKVHCDRLKPQPVSRVYHGALTAARALARTQVTRETESTGQEGNRTTRERGEMSPTDSTEPEVPILGKRKTSDKANPDPDVNSGVTDVLEALDRGDFRYRSSSEEDPSGPEDSFSEDDTRQVDEGNSTSGDEASEERYVTIPVQREVPLQRYHRRRQPPDWYRP